MAALLEELGLGLAALLEEMGLGRRLRLEFWLELKAVVLLWQLTGWM